MAGMDVVLGSVSFGRPGVVGWVAAAAVAMVVLVLLSYRGSPMRGGRRVAAICAKVAGFLILLACWLEPQWVSRVPKERANTVVLLSDDSRSMSLPMAQGARSRGEELREMWRTSGPVWRASLERDFQLRSFRFGADVRELRGPEELSFEQSPTSMGAALEGACERAGGKSAALVVFTDGVATDLAGRDLAGLPPVYPVLIGGALSVPDIGLGTVTATQSAFEDAPVSVQAEVRVSGMEGVVPVRVWAEVVEPAPAPGSKGIAAETQVEVRGGRAVAQLQIQAVQPGAAFYRLRVESPAVKPEAELTQGNNARLFCVNRARGPHAILYVAGRPNWEFGPMRRALEGDGEIELRGLIRVAKREPKFSFKGRGGESANPLFRGFKDGADPELQRYDQPVIVRVNVEEAGELAAGFPKTAEELFKFKGVILDDVEAEFFTAEQQRLLQRFAGERGGGLLMLGGMESFAGGHWQGTAVESVLPVWIGKEEAQEEGGFQWRLTRQGLLEPWVRRRKTEAAESARTERLPALEVLNHVQGIKPAATVLAASYGEERSLLVMQRYGLGRSGAMLAGDLFQWGIGQPEHGADLAKLWRQIARWLVADAPNRVEAGVQWAASEQAAKVQVRVRDEQARPVEDAEVSVRVRRVGEKEEASVSLVAEAGGEPGLYVLEYPSANGGALVAQVSARSADGRELGVANAGWVQESAWEEFNATTPDRAAMEEVARKTGGAVLSMEEIGGLAGRLQNAAQLVTEVRIRPLWHTGPVMGLALLCLVAEWVLRRRNGAS